MERIPAHPELDPLLVSARALFVRALEAEGLPAGMVFAAFSPDNAYAGLYNYTMERIHVLYGGLL